MEGMQTKRCEEDLSSNAKKTRSAGWNFRQILFGLKIDGMFEAMDLHSVWKRCASDDVTFGYLAKMHNRCGDFWDLGLLWEGYVAREGLGGGKCACGGGARCRAWRRGKEIAGRKAQCSETCEVVVIATAPRCDGTPSVIFVDAITGAFEAVHIDRPLVSVEWGEIAGRAKAFKRQSHLDAPTLIAITALVEGSAYIDRDRHSAVIREFAPRTGRTVACKERVEDHPCGRDLEFDVVAAVAIGVDVEFDDFLLKQRIIAAFVGAEDIVVVHIERDVKITCIPHHFGFGAFLGASVVVGEESSRGCGFLPDRIVEFAVECGRNTAAIGHIDRALEFSSSQRDRAERDAMLPVCWDVCGGCHARIAVPKSRHQVGLVVGKIGRASKAEGVVKKLACLPVAAVIETGGGVLCFVEVGEGSVCAAISLEMQKGSPQQFHRPQWFVINRDLGGFSASHRPRCDIGPVQDDGGALSGFGERCVEQQARFWGVLQQDLLNGFGFLCIQFAINVALGTGGLVNTAPCRKQERSKDAEASRNWLLHLVFFSSSGLLFREISRGSW